MLHFNIHKSNNANRWPWMEHDDSDYTKTHNIQNFVYKLWPSSKSPYLRSLPLSKTIRLRLNPKSQAKEEGYNAFMKLRAGALCGSSLSFLLLEVAAFDMVLRRDLEDLRSNIEEAKEVSAALNDKGPFRDASRGWLPTAASWWGGGNLSLLLLALASDIILNLCTICRWIKFTTIHCLVMKKVRKKDRKTSVWHTSKFGCSSAFASGTGIARLDLSRALVRLFPSVMWVFSPKPRCLLKQNADG